MSYPVTNLQQRIDQLLGQDQARLKRLWRYYRNPMRLCAAGQSDNASQRPYRQGQEWGLPARITGLRPGSDSDNLLFSDEIARKEVVIENDIGWRIETQVDYLFGRPLVIESLATDPQRKQIIGQLLQEIFTANGGITFLQQLAQLGSIYGFVDVLVKFSGDAGSAGPGDPSPSPRGEMEGEGEQGGKMEQESAPSQISPTNPATSILSCEHLGRLIRLELIEPARALPILSTDDYRVVESYAQVYTLPRNEQSIKRAAVKQNWIERFFRMGKSSSSSLFSEDRKLVVELLDANHWMRFEDGDLVASGANSLGEIPLVHIQNIPIAFEYSGTSDVEPLIPLQDELNTRLSDRANRIALQSFKMYLGIGVEGFGDVPVGPGRMWMTDNEQAKVLEFGGDANCPSESNHIADVREAMDKISAVTPVAAGAIKNRIGRLTSAAALRVTLLALLSKTEKKRTTYGGGIERICQLALKWLDAAGLFPTTPDERRVELHWASPLPQNDLEKLQEAEAKLRVGVPAERVLKELGY